MSSNKRGNTAEAANEQPSRKQQRSSQRGPTTTNENVLEEGHVFLFYRSKVNVEEAESMEDVKRTYIVTLPQFTKAEGNRKVPAARIIALPKKKLPDVDNHERFACFVEDIFDNMDDVKGYLKEEKYETKTRGERTNPKATLIAAGVYGFVLHDDHSHLIMALDESSQEQTSNVWPEFNIRPTMSLLLQVKSPGAGGPPNAPAQEADFPEDLREKFGNRRWIPIDSSRFLDYPGCQFLLIGAKEDIVQELGKPGEEVQQQEEREFPGEPEKTKSKAISELSLSPSDVKFGPLYGEFE